MCFTPANGAVSRGVADLHNSPHFPRVTLGITTDFWRGEKRKEASKATGAREKKVLAGHLFFASRPSALRPKRKNTK